MSTTINSRVVILNSIAVQQGAEAKRLLGQFIIDQNVADRIVDCILSAAVAEASLMFSKALQAADHG